MHRRPTLFGAVVKTVADHLAFRASNEDKKGKGIRLLCEVVGWGLFGTAAGMVALPFGLAVGGVAFFAFSLQLR